MSGSTVLIADDDDSLLRVLTVRCRHLGLEVITAPNTAIAKDQILKHKPDLLILDVKMPGGGAFEVCDMVMSIQELAATPVIILTGNTSRQAMDESRRVGAFYVPKSPYLWSTLKPMLGRWLSISRAES